MNERFKELLEQTDIPHFPILGSLAWVATDHDMKKFAELIVKECAAICINKNVSNLDLDIIREAGKFTLQDLATKSCGKNLSKQIKLHFGVEE